MRVLPARPLPDPKSAYLVFDGRDPIPLSLEKVIKERYSSGSELWLEVWLPRGIGNNTLGSPSKDGRPVPGVRSEPRTMLVIEFAFKLDDGERYLRNGYQSWSFAGLERVGQPIERPGVDMAVMSHFSHLKPPVNGEVLLESESFFVLEGLVACTLDGRKAPACFFGTHTSLLLSFDISRVNVEAVEARGDVGSSGIHTADSLAPGVSSHVRSGKDRCVSETTHSDRLLDVVVFESCGSEGTRMSLDHILCASGLQKRARASAPLYSGWCSWYQYFSDISEKELMKNLSLAEKNLGFVDVFQLDDGYQRSIGDWLDTNDKFPSGIEKIANRISEAGFIPGIWIAPFVATTESSLFRNHPEWFLKLPNGSPVPAMLNLSWGGNGFAYALDCTHPEVLGWLENLGSALEAAGFRYVKIDFCYAASMHGSSALPLGRAQALVSGVRALRKGLGDKVFLLGCGIPLWPVVGLVDGMRIGPDVAPTFWPQQEIYGLTHSLPALANAWRNTVARSLMHRKLWVNDPDCIMLRKTQTGLDPHVAREWGQLVANLGQMVIVSDDLSLYGREEIALLQDLVETAKENDLLAGVPSPGIDPFDPSSYTPVMERNERS